MSEIRPLHYKIPKEEALRSTSEFVPLHILCPKCSDFCSSWEVLEWLQEADKKKEQAWTSAHLSTIAHLEQYQDSCHFCRFVLGSLEKRFKYERSNLQDENVYLHARKQDEQGVEVALLVGQEEIRREEKGDHYSSFFLRTYQNSEAGGFNSHITETIVPLYAKDNIYRVKSWIETCLTQHLRCQHFHCETVINRNQRPTRVLDITEHNIRLRCDLVDKPFEYLVLSHMWGSNLTPQLRLLKTNLSAFQLSIPRAEIETSATFKEAIRVTRCLGYRYLWIDSLCILQDSETDWEYEARRMAIVYGNAVCNLAFLFPPHSNNNCRARDDPRKWNPCILRSVTEGGCPGVYIEHIGSLFRQEFGHEEKTRPWLVQRDWPLFDRAWTFQEYLLSPRTLLLGHQNLMFQCSQLFHDELLGSLPDMQPTSNETPKRGKDRGKSRYFPPTIRELRSASSLSEPAVLSFMADWQNVINEYRSRRLSFAKDRVVAFAGIARAFANIGDLTYLAGAYKEIFPVCLLWYVDKKSPVRVRLENSLPQGVPLGDIWTSAITEPIEHAAPSWSWFSVPIYRYYQLHFLLGDDELFVRCKSYKNPELVCFNDIFWADLSSFQFESHPPEHVLESAFFEFTSLRVTLATLVLPVRENWPADLTAQMGILRTTSTSELDRDFNWDPVFTYYPDIPLGRKTPKQNAIYAVLAEFQVVRTAGKNNIQRRLAGLVLIPGPHAGTWTRVGVWKLRINVSNVAVESKNMAHVAERWRGLEMLSPKWVFALITIV